MEIEKVLKTDLPEILALQHLAYQSEANLFSSRDIPPLRQTIEELTAEYQKTAVQFWKVSVQGKIVGSVRTEKQKETVLIGKLMVLPAYQKQGIGSQMMKMVEQICIRGIDWNSSPVPVVLPIFAFMRNWDI